MSVEDIIQLTCDGYEDCGEVYVGACGNSIITRASAQAESWFCLRGKDYCPECAERPQIIKDFADGIHGTPAQIRDRLSMCWRYMRDASRKHFGGEDDFVAEIEAEIAGCEKAAREPEGGIR